MVAYDLEPGYLCTYKSRIRLDSQVQQAKAYRIVPPFIFEVGYTATATLVDAQELIHNFQVASRNNTHITFYWDIVDGYINIFHRERSGYSSYRSSIYIYIDR